MANVVHSDGVVCQICLKKRHSAIACFNRHNEFRFPTVVDRKSRFRPRQGPKYLMKVSSGPSIPTGVKTTLTDPIWLQAMTAELDALNKNDTWSLVKKNDSMNVLASKWVYKNKLDDKGKIIHHKARLVAVGSNQKDGIDFSKTFAPVVKPAMIRIILSVSVTRGWKLHQLDVCNAFLHGFLDENVYMRQLPGFIDKSQQHHVCKLRKSIYSLRQSPRVWFRRLRDFLLLIGFRESQSDQSLFIYSDEGVLAYFLVYVDDIILTSSSEDFSSSVIKKLGLEFALKDLGPLCYFLGIHITTLKNGDILIS